MGLRTSQTHRVGDRGTPEVEGQIKRSAELPKARVARLCESMELRQRSGIQMITLDVETSDSIDIVKMQLEKSKRLILRTRRRYVVHIRWRSKCAKGTSR